MERICLEILLWIKHKSIKSRRKSSTLLVFVPKSINPTCDSSLNSLSRIGWFKLGRTRFLTDLIQWFLSLILGIIVFFRLEKSNSGCHWGMRLENDILCFLPILFLLIINSSALFRRSDSSKGYKLSVIIFSFLW